MAEVNDTSEQLSDPEVGIGHGRYAAEEEDTRRAPIRTSDTHGPAAPEVLNLIPTNESQSSDLKRIISEIESEIRRAEIRRAESERRTTPYESLNQTMQFARRRKTTLCAVIGVIIAIAMVVGFSVSLSQRKTGASPPTPRQTKPPSAPTARPSMPRVAPTARPTLLSALLPTSDATARPTLPPTPGPILPPTSAPTARPSMPPGETDCFVKDPGLECGGIIEPCQMTLPFLSPHPPLELIDICGVSDHNSAAKEQCVQMCSPAIRCCVFGDCGNIHTEMICKEYFGPCNEASSEVLDSVKICTGQSQETKSCRDKCKDHVCCAGVIEVSNIESPVEENRASSAEEKRAKAAMAGAIIGAVVGCTSVVIGFWNRKQSKSQKPWEELMEKVLSKQVKLQKGTTAHSLPSAASQDDDQNALAPTSLHEMSTSSQPATTDDDNT